jgi:callose synthase
MKSSKDHQEKCNYDDINEFFWSRNCLQYQYSSESGLDGYDEESSYRLTGRLPGESLPGIIEGLENAPKTFLEKRSWLRGVIALYRIFEWHLVTFYLLAVIAFSRELVWGWVYTLQVASGVFWIFNFLQVTFGVLEVWSVYPGIQLTGTAVCGSVFSLGTRFLILSYQTFYLMWTFGPSSENHLGIDEDSNFWWWQYVWLSLLCMIPWMVEALMQLYPASSTALYTSKNDYVQSFLNILFPLSRIYTGKEVHESFGHTAIYIFYWITLMAWKLFFSYVFEVYTMVLPTLELTDDFINYPNQSFAKMSLLLTMRWLPQFLVYLIDMSIWYAVWQAFAGTAVGFSENLGDIKTMGDIRDNFGRAPELFCTKMLSPDAGSRRGSAASFISRGSNSSIGDESQALLGSDPHRLQSYVNRLLDVKIQKWVMFSAAWNEIVDHFRQEDIISNRERDNLKFSRFEGFSQAIYLPVFQTAGVMEDIVTILESPREDLSATVTDEDLFKSITSHVTMRTAVYEVWELGTFLLQKILGPVHSPDVIAVTGLVLKWAKSGSITDHVDVVKVRQAMKTFIQLVTTLEKGIGRRKPAVLPRKQAEPTSKKPIRRAMSATSLATASIEGHDQIAQKSTAAKLVIIDALRDQTRDKVRAFVQAVKGLMKTKSAGSEEIDVADRLTFMMSIESGFIWDDAYASDQLDALSKDVTFKEVLGKLHGLVACHPADVEPKSKEARRRLTFFVNSLFMDMPNAPSIHDMFSFNVLTPYYSEDVLYNKGDLEKRTDELGVSTLLYLQTLFQNDWKNFLERLSIDDPEKIWSKKFMQETRIWASIRSQSLYRTVSGMMYYEKALRLLANLERLDDDSTNDLMGEKFGYIVSCQVYGNQKKNQDPKAEDIEDMLHRFPHLRVAYIDSIRVNRAGATIYYSCLVKSDGHGGIEEIYRVRLPGNPVIGEGKPENQNHAMIFTRGEFIQTIDMNQEGYFEEALKMRNALQEFAKREGPLPTTILGLREHIFTASVSSLANYMALQETSFVTLGQRVLTKPLRIRLHYGHPDVFDKLFFITRGGISKSSKGINLSEDIFAGYNNAIRGGQVGFKEYLQVGKGRDVGMSQIYKFEAKLSQGAGEQSLSRDVYRLCHRLDFCRLLSYYYGGIGHYFSNVLTVLTIYCVVYLMAVLAVFNLEKIGDRTITPMGTIQIILGGLGLLQTIPLYATLGVERGWWNSLREIFQVFVTGGPFHFMFHIQTKAHYMSQTILVGGAKYRATGRGFVTQHTPMDEQFRFFASSHLYLGVELAAGLLIMWIYTDAGQYIGRTWSLWLAATSFLASPFWFNPMSFEWNVVVSDYKIYLDWLGSSSGGVTKSWSQWWSDDNAHYKKMHATSKMFFVVKAIIYLLLANGIRTSELLKANQTLNKPLINVGVLTVLIVVLCGFAVLFRSTQGQLPYAAKQTIGIIIFLGISAGVFTLFLEDSDTIRYSLAGYYAIGALCQLGLLFGVKAVKSFYFVHDLLCGHILFIPLFILAALQLPHHIQTWLLYHNALSTDVVISDILRYAQKTQKSDTVANGEDLIQQLAELRKVVQRQEDMLAGVGLKQADKSVKRNESTDAIAELVAPNSDEDEVKISRPVAAAGGMGGRALSMSGLDVWGPMTIGEGTQTDRSNEGFASYQNAEYTSNPTQSNPMQDFTFSQPDQMPPR